MFARLKSGIGSEILIPVSEDSVTNASDQSIREAVQSLLDQAENPEDGEVERIREAIRDPNSVIEVKTEDGFQPIDGGSAFSEAIQSPEGVEIMVTRPNAGG